MALAAVELRNVSVAFKGHKIFTGANLRVEEGESVVLIGPSGHGKSVLLKLMAGLITPDQGEVLVRGENFAKLSGARRQEFRNKMGMLFQRNALFDSLSCGENVALPLREATNHSETEIQKIVDKYLSAVGIIEAKNLHPDEISGGMQKRLGIARALALSPEIVFFDDPTAGLDPITSRKIIELILSLRTKKAGCQVAITNEMGRAYQMADRIIMVLDRELIVAGSVEQTKKNSDPRIQQFIHGKVHGPLSAGMEVYD